LIDSLLRFDLYEGMSFTNPTNETSRARELGCNRAITRRDFLNGIAVGVAGASLLGASRRASASLPADYYPPELTGLRGSHEGSFEVAHQVRDGAYLSFPRLDADTGEEYDLVVVGAGISGLAAAHFFRKMMGADKRVLILDNHDDFGGHAKRNEFTYQGRTFIGYGGTMSIETPFPYSYVSRALVEELGIQVDRYSEFHDGEIYSKLGLKAAMFFDRESFGEDRLVPGMPSRRGGEWREFLDRTPLSEKARGDLFRLYDGMRKDDHLHTLAFAERKEQLARMSYQDYLVKHAGVSREALPFLWHMSFRNNKYIDTCPALEAARSGAPGFQGLGLEDPPRLGWEDYHFHFPDGNATMARLLVNRLIPKALPGDHDMESVVRARLLYQHLDEVDCPVRLRLNSTVVRVEHEGPAEKADWVRLAYVSGGKVHGVRARNAVLACYNSIVRFLMPELPEKQKSALAESAKVPLLYTNVFIRNWKSFEKLGVSRVSCPNMYHSSVSLDQPVSMGGYECPKTPEEPIVLHLSKSPSAPGLFPRRVQLRAGMQELFTTPFETMELSIRDQLGRMLSSGGFDPAEDILGITVNRWPHGYAYTPDTLSDPDVPEAERPHVVGRQPFGRVAIANSDAGAAAFTNTAIDEAHRAVSELARTREPY
jgi:spermidine dehydrogenase